MPAQSIAIDRKGRYRQPLEDTDMDRQYSPRKFIGIFVAIAIAVMSMATTVAQADWLSPAFYGDELDRCAAELRSELDLTGVARLRHAVTEIDKMGVWYVFDIHTEMANDAGAVIARTDTRCKAHRWNERTVVEVTYSTPVSDIHLAQAK